MSIDLMSYSINRKKTIALYFSEIPIQLEISIWLTHSNNLQPQQTHFFYFI